MKVTITRFDKTIELKFHTETTRNYITLLPDHIWQLKTSHSTAVCDGYYTIRRSGNELFIWQYNECVVHIRNIDLSRFFDTVLNKAKSLRKLTVETKSFTPKHQETRMLGWVEIGEKVDKSALHVIVNARKKGVSSQLKPILQRLAPKSNVFADSYQDDELSFYFDGRNHPDGCGFNGGIIFHTSQNTYSVHT